MNDSSPVENFSLALRQDMASALRLRACTGDLILLYSSLLWSKIFTYSISNTDPAPSKSKAEKNRPSLRPFSLNLADLRSTTYSVQYDLDLDQHLVLVRRSFLSICTAPSPNSVVRPTWPSSAVKRQIWLVLHNGFCGHSLAIYTESG